MLKSEVNNVCEENLVNEFEIEVTELTISEADSQGTDAVFFRSTTTCSCTC